MNRLTWIVFVLSLPLAALGCAGDDYPVEGHVFDLEAGCWGAVPEVVATLSEEPFCGELTWCAVRPMDGAPVMFGTTCAELGWASCGPTERALIEAAPVCPAP